MAETLISVEDISKKYKLGSFGAGSLRRDLQEWLDKKRGKKHDFDPAREVQALDHVGFQVKRGEAIGIIGSNGSGKSTLLKIISRIIQPSGGRVRGRGKISSILEVGTGFHHELSGRENIYISGYTLGMSKHEIERKFDEIVAFSGVERFLDTPVKRYSSGMYVRLAFAVSAHLEPDILIVDEVLAVGDAAFQKKCLGKMESSSHTDGRTILFVSHNMQAIEHLCSRAIWLEKGKLRKDGESGNVIRSYLASTQQDLSGKYWDDPEQAPGNERIRIKSVKASPIGNSEILTVNTPIRIHAEFYSYIDIGEINVNLALYSNEGICVFNIGSSNIKAYPSVMALEAIIPAALLNDQTYKLTLTVMKDQREIVHHFHQCLIIEVGDEREGMDYFGEWPGLIRPNIDMQFYCKDIL